MTPALVRSTPDSLTSPRPTWADTVEHEAGPVPVAALPRLRVRCLSTWARPGEPVTWRSHCHTPWAAVTDLHRAGDHDTAVALARVVRHTEQQGGTAGSGLMWRVDENTDAEKEN